MVGPKRKTKVKIQKVGRYGKYKSRSKIQKFVKTPGGRTIVHYKGKKLSKSICAICGKMLAGKRPERPHGGNLCSSCTRRKIIESARAK